MEHSYIGNKMMQALELLISPEGPHHKAQVVWAGDYGGEEPGYDSNLYHLCEEKQCVKSIFQSQHVYPMLVNHSKCCYIDMSKLKQGDIHPFPLLTMETDSNGGGDYDGINEEFLGIWARDIFSVELTAPENYEKVSFEFCECEL